MATTISDNEASFRLNMRKARVMKTPAVLLLMAVVPCLSFATEREAISTITKLWSYPAYGNGDIVFEVAAPATGCKGFWLAANDPGTNRTYALLLSAYHTQNTVRIRADDTLVWPGSGDVYCRVSFAGVL